MLTIHGVPISVHTRKVIVTSLEKQIAYRNEPVIPFSPPAGWTELSPTGKIPVVTDGDLVLRDSSVICTYLERTYPVHRIYPKETGDLVQALWLEEYADGTIFRDVIHGLFFQKIIRPNISKQETDTKVIDSILGETMPKVFGYLEQSAGNEFLAGASFSIADIAVVSNLINFRYLGFALDARQFPQLAAYFERQLARPSIQAALVQEKATVAAMGLDSSFLQGLAASAA
jgi:glutathione S-transferase